MQAAKFSLSHFNVAFFRVRLIFRIDDFDKIFVDATSFDSGFSAKLNFFTL